jgi:hypothetical protein
LAFRKVGAERIGANATKAIMDEAIKREREGILKEPEDNELIFSKDSRVY